MKPEELAKLTTYFRKTFGSPMITVRKRPQKNDSCEVYISEEFIGVISKDEEDGELSYHFSMAILDIDLE